jgi:hypothetical protein
VSLDARRNKAHNRISLTKGIAEMKTLPAFPRVAKVTTLDGATFAGTAAQIVAAMRAQSRTPGADVAEYRTTFAARALLWMKQPIRTNDDESFLLDLSEVGLLVIETATRATVRNIRSAQ